MEQGHNTSVAVHTKSSSLCGGEKTHWLIDFLRKRQPAEKSKGSNFWGLWGPRGAAGRWHPCEPPSSPHWRDKAGVGEPHRPKGQQSKHRRQKRPPGPMSRDTGQHGAPGLPRGTLQKSGKQRTPTTPCPHIPMSPPCLGQGLLSPTGFCTAPLFVHRCLWTLL